MKLQDVILKAMAKKISWMGEHAKLWGAHAAGVVILIPDATRLSTVRP